MTGRFSPIGVIHSCFKEKFGIPRQPGLAPAATATLELYPPFDAMETLRGLEDVSHIWIIFVFHAVPAGRWSPTVRPPRLGGNRRLGVFATRSGFRPNPIGMSAVRLVGMTRRNGTTVLDLAGGDLMDGTPVLDIKPYLPYADAISHAQTGFAQHRPEPTLDVCFSPTAMDQCRKKSAALGVDIESLIRGILSMDPRPAYAAGKDKGRDFGIRLFDFDLRWQVRGRTARILALSPLTRKDKTNT